MFNDIQLVEIFHSFAVDTVSRMTWADLEQLNDMKSTFQKIHSYQGKDYDFSIEVIEFEPNDSKPYFMLMVTMIDEKQTDEKTIGSAWLPLTTTAKVLNDGSFDFPSVSEIALNAQYT